MKVPPVSPRTLPHNDARVPRLALSPDEACAALGCGRPFLDQHVLPDLRVARVGRRRFVPVKELERWLAFADDPELLRDGYARQADFEAALERHRLAGEFRDAVQEAEADAKVGALARIQKAGREGTWQADAWYLERKYPREFGRRIHEVSGPEGGSVEVADARARVATMLDRLAGANALAEDPEHATP